MTMRTVLYAALLGTAALAMILNPQSVTIGQTPAAEVTPKSPSAEKFRVSLSVSPFTEAMLQKGVVFTDGKINAQTPEAVQRLFMAYGANEVYARISTTRNVPIGMEDHSVHRGLERAALAKTLGLPFNPEIGLWKNYGDVTHQPPPDFTDYPQLKVPGAWTSLTLDQMLPILRAYGELIAREILGTGARVRIWDLGNEVEFGCAGVAIDPTGFQAGPGDYKAPDGIDPEIGKMNGLTLMRMPEARRIDWLKTHLWPYEGKMLAAVAAGIRTVEPKARFSTHVSGITAVMPSQAVAFYKTLKENGFFPDELGFSFYPTSRPNSWKLFQETATAVHRELGRPLFITEYGYPSGKMTPPFVWNTPEANYPLTPEGQAAFTHDLVAWGVKSGILSGIRPWAPDYAGPGWAPMAFFERDGKTATARPALSAIQAALNAKSQ